MLERPALADGAIVGLVRDNYGMAVGELVFLPIGNDAATWVYRLQTEEGRDYLLKVRAAAGFRASSLLVPHYLRQHGLGHIIAARATRDGALWVAIADFVVTIYPFIEGQVGASAGLSAKQWRTFGKLIKQVHSCRLPAELLAQVRRETFVPGGRDLIPRLEAAAGNRAFASETERALALFWRMQREVIDAVVQGADALGEQLRQMRQGHVLCHADMHPWNLLLGTDGELWLVDWDEVVMALKERDLMFAVGGIGGDGAGPQQSEWFLQGYGPAQIDEEALAYYRYAWALQDIAEYGRAVFLDRELGEVSRQAALQGFKGLFAARAIVDIALNC